MMSVLLIFPLPQLAIDLYLPSLPIITKLLHTSHYYLQLCLTVYIFALGIAQLIYGPLSDCFGRKPLLLSGMLVFLIGSMGCAVSHSINQLLLANPYLQKCLFVDH